MGLVSSEDSVFDRVSYIILHARDVGIAVILNRQYMQQCDTEVDLPNVGVVQSLHET